jgi:peptide methionine sulfoxide reductase MsrB
MHGIKKYQIRKGTHLGHNLPDKSGSRYCINLVSVAGNPVD